MKKTTCFIFLCVFSALLAESAGASATVQTITGSQTYALYQSTGWVNKSNSVTVTFGERGDDGKYPVSITGLYSSNSGHNASNTLVFNFNGFTVEGYFNPASQMFSFAQGQTIGAVTENGTQENYGWYNVNRTAQAGSVDKTDPVTGKLADDSITITLGDPTNTVFPYLGTCTPSGYQDQTWRDTKIVLSSKPSLPPGDSQSSPEIYIDDEWIGIDEVTGDTTYAQKAFSNLTYPQGDLSFFNGERFLPNPYIFTSQAPEPAGQNSWFTSKGLAGKGWKASDLYDKLGTEVSIRFSDKFMGKAIILGWNSNLYAQDKDILWGCFVSRLDQDGFVPENNLLSSDGGWIGAAVVPDVAQENYDHLYAWGDPKTGDIQVNGDPNGTPGSSYVRYGNEHCGFAGLHFHDWYPYRRSQWASDQYETSVTYVIYLYYVIKNVSSLEMLNNGFVDPHCVKFEDMWIYCPLADEQHRHYNQLGMPGYKFTVKHAIEHELNGDINQDGKIDVSDVTALINQILGTGHYSEGLCDLNGDGKINVSDVTALINLILNKS